MTRLYAGLLSIAFAVLLLLPGASMFFWPASQRMHRVAPVAYPEFEASSAWLSAFEKYFVANFGYKRRLVQLHNALGYRVLGDVQSDDVLVGRDGWLFLERDQGWKSLRAEQPLPAEHLDSWRHTLQATKQLLDSRRIPFFYVLVPSKETIYPEFLPASATRARSLTHLDELLPVFLSVGVEVLDLRQPLLRAKSEQLYDRLDSHWNGRGAEVAATLLLERAAALLRRPDSFAQLSASLIPRESPADLASMLQLGEYYREESLQLLPAPQLARRVQPPESAGEVAWPASARMRFEAPDATLPSALFMRDSFGAALMDLVAEKFRRSYWIWTNDVDLRSLDQEPPDLVVLQVAERLLSGPPPGLLGPSGAAAADR